MIDQRFYKSVGPFSVKEVLEFCSIESVQWGEGVTPHHKISNIAPLENAGPDDLSVLHNPKYVTSFQQSKAGFCLATAECAATAPRTMTVLVTAFPYRAFGIISDRFYPHHEACISPQTSSIHPSAQIGEGCHIGYGAVICAGAEIGAHTIIGPNSVIGPNVKVGEKCHIGSGCQIYFSLIQDRVIMYPGACVGQAGFGFFMDENGHVKIPQLGRVIIEDDVEIGANTTIDRGSLHDTVIGRGCRIDNLVQIAHNVKIGKGCVIVSQVGIAGSTVLGNYVIAAGQAGLAGHLKIGNGVKIAAQTGVMRDVSDGEVIAGSPAVPVRQWHRQTATLAKLVKPKS